MNEHFFVTADHAHLRIYLPRQEPGQREPALDLVESMDFPFGKASYTARDTSMAGRFQGSRHQAPGPGAPTDAGRTGMSIDERLPMQREEERRRGRDVAERIEAFFASRPTATWDFAAPAEFRHVVTEQVSNRVRDRLRREIAKDLVNQSTEQLRAHYVAAGR